VYIANKIWDQFCLFTLLLYRKYGCQTVKTKWKKPFSFSAIAAFSLNMTIKKGKFSYLSSFSFHDRNMVKVYFNTTPKYFAENVFFVQKIISKNIELKLTLNLCKSTGYSIFSKRMNLS
jgi:hypothetical protein